MRHCLALCFAVLAACATPQVAEVPPSPGAAHVADAYLAMMGSATPPDSTGLAREAFRLAKQDAPASIGGEPAAIAEVLRAQLRVDEGQGWELADALVRSTGNPHLFLTTPERAAALGAGPSGAPWTSSGFLARRDQGGAMVVTDVLPDSPAAAAGVLAGDVILNASVPLLPFPMFSLTGLPDGQAVALEVDRAGARKSLSLTMKVAPPPVLRARVVEGVGVLQVLLVTRSEDASRDLVALTRAAMAEHAAAGVKAWVLDLRGCPGGEGPAGLASLFTAADPLLRIRDPAGALHPMPRDGAPPSTTPRVVVLVDEQTGSSAEMVALALQRAGAAQVLGQPTAGGLSLPGAVDLGGGHLLLVPQALVLGPADDVPPAGARVQPDTVVANATAAEAAAGKDAQLEAALKLLR